jgi:hypothetical protein
MNPNQAQKAVLNELIAKMESWRDSDDLDACMANEMGFTAKLMNLTRTGENENYQAYHIASSLGSILTYIKQIK